MAKKLHHNYPKRVFTFGCSFTDYLWATWANIIGAEYSDAEFRNFARAGAGNFYIFNTLMQADAVYNFNHNDLVIVQWTNVCREDRYLPQKDGWLVPGNIYTQNEYDEKWVQNYFSEYGAYLRDFSFIHAAHEHLKHKCQWHFLQMMDIVDFTDQWDLNKKSEIHDKIKHLADIYKPDLDNILPSFYQICFQNNLEKKFKEDRKLINKNFQDGHPHPMEHYNYLKTVFKHDWKDETDNKVSQTFNKWKKFMNDASHDKSKFHIYSLGQKWIDMIRYELRIRPGDQIDPRIHT